MKLETAKARLEKVKMWREESRDMLHRIEQDIRSFDVVSKEDLTKLRNMRKNQELMVDNILRLTDKIDNLKITIQIKERWG